MTKIEELKAAYEAATKGAWRTFEDDESTDVMDKHGDHILTMCGLNDSRDATFIALAHNLMPQLLEAVELLKELRNSLSQYDDGEWYLHDGTEPRLDYIDEVLEKLK